MRKSKHLLTVYLRHGCHLCEALLAELEPWRATPPDDLELEFELVDVDRDPALAARYGEFVPVLSEGETQICHYFFDPEALARHLGRDISD